ncbi:MAG: transposase, partial [Abditibacteriales bacterium]|nr:transposase [Abditibacteriales bacterium]
MSPNRARQFARSLRPYLKTDVSDAVLLARYAEASEPPDAPVRSAAQATLQALWGRREQLVRMLEAEKKRLATAGHPQVAASITRLIEVLEAELAQVEAELAQVEASDAELAARGALVRSMVGIGRVAAWGLLAELPELGQVSRQAIAALVGLAPMAWESGGRKGVRRLRGG